MGLDDRDVENIEEHRRQQRERDASTNREKPWRTFDTGTSSDRFVFTAIRLSGPGDLFSLGMSMAFRELERRIKRSVKFEPCLPRPAKEPPSGPGWLHEIKHDGFRIIAQKEGERARLITRNGHDFTDRYTLIVDAIQRLPVKSCVIDGEAIVVDQGGLSVFDLLRYRRHDHAATLCAFDLVEVSPVRGNSQPITLSYGSRRLA